MTNRRYFRGSSMLAVAFALGLAGTASAQTADTPAEVEEVIVTGSFIAGTPEDAAMPVDVLPSAGVPTSRPTYPPYTLPKLLESI